MSAYARGSSGQPAKLLRAISIASSNLAADFLKIGGIAQIAEHRAFNPTVQLQFLVPSLNLGRIAKRLMHLPLKEKIEGLNPSALI